MLKLKKWQHRHNEIIKSLVSFFNKKSADFILKGGTALMLCYGLDRFYVR
ncbi:MAG: nucleotidyl transferase AbiEii/AbiGii toxin family protein [Oscillospiraceae bacterium]|nr:nucleotidyl transferase AbiEii/AbiGii toxin family protein [Oscillospiraceae bacterium]